MFSRIVLAASAALMLTGGAALAQDVIQTRKAGFEDYKKAMGEIKDAVGKGDLAAIGPVTDRIDAFAAKIPSLFPPGSDKGKTAAKAPAKSTHKKSARKAKKHAKKAV